LEGVWFLFNDLKGLKAIAFTNLDGPPQNSLISFVVLVRTLIDKLLSSHDWVLHR